MFVWDMFTIATEDPKTGMKPLQTQDIISFQIPPGLALQDLAKADALNYMKLNRLAAAATTYAKPTTAVAQILMSIV